MQISEFIEATNTLEQYYDKELTDTQRQIMFEELKNLSVERYRKLISKCLKTCKYMPKIADIIAANLELVGEINEDDRKYYPCNKCDSSGVVFYTKFKNNGNVRIPYTYVARCNCENSKYVNNQIPCYEELGIQISTRLNQIKDTQRNIENIKNVLFKNMN